MNTPSDIQPEPTLEPIVTSPMGTTRPLYWSVRRELWENRSTYVAPLAAAAVVLFGFTLGIVNLAHSLRGLSRLGLPQQAAELAKPYDFAAIAVIFTSLVVGVFYCLGALHNERRDRSILFWKSLPVSDLTTVLSKASIPLVVLPLVTFATIFAMQSVMLLLSTAVLLPNGQTVEVLWTQTLSPQGWLELLYSLAALALWHAPIYGWLLLVSGWARRAPFLWAFLPPLALCVVEKIAFDTSYFASLLSDRIGGFTQAFADGAFSDDVHGGAGGPLSQLDPVRFLSSPGLWAGLVAAAAFLAAAVWQRRRREPI
jgi:ABC-2 type transport system permease protein